MENIDNFVIIGETSNTNEWVLAVSKLGTEKIEYKRVNKADLIKSLRYKGILEDYLFIDDCDDFGNTKHTKIYVADTRHLHVLSKVDTKEKCSINTNYVLLSVNSTKQGKNAKTAILLELSTGRLLQAKINTMGTLGLRFRIGNDIVIPNNIWLDDKGNFKDNHYLNCVHSNSLEDISIGVYDKTVQVIMNFNKYTDTELRNENIDISVEAHKEETHNEEKVEVLEKVEAPKEEKTPEKFETPENLKPDNEEPKQEHQEKPNNILNIKDTDHEVIHGQNIVDNSDNSDTDDTDDEINKYYDSDGNCIDFDGLSAYLDKQKAIQNMKDAEKKREAMAKPSIEVGISEAFKNVLDTNEKRWVCITKNDLYTELVFSMTERGTIDVPSSLIGYIPYRIIKTLDGGSFEFREIGTDKNGVVQMEEIEKTPEFIYLIELYNGSWKKYYLLQVNGNFSNRVKLQCISDWVEKTDDVDFSIFTKKYIQWIGRKEYLRISDWE